MGQVTSEIVRAKLVFGVIAFGFEIDGPLGQLRPIEAGEIRVAFHLRHRAEKQQKVAALLDRHLVLFRPLPAAVALAVGVRVLSQVMRREGELPTLRGRVAHERHHEGLGQRRPKQQELGRHGVKHVRGRDAAVAVVFLAELQRFAVGVRHELAGREALAVGQGADARVMLAARLPQVGQEFAVESRAP